MNVPLAKSGESSVRVDQRRFAELPLLERPFYLLRLGAPHTLFWLGGPLLLYVWTLGGPFLADDLNLILKSEAYQRGERDELGLYRFADSDEEWQRLRDRGTIPWWSPESGRLDFLRPVSEWIFYADVFLYGRRPVFYRLTSLLIFALALFSVRWMFLRASGDTVRAGVATYFFGVSQTVTPPVTWMCNRQDLLVVIGVSLAAGAYWAIVASGRRRFFLMAVGAFAIALFSKEVAIALAAVIGLHELIRRWQSKRWFDDPMPLAIALATVAMSILFVAYYAYSRPWVFDLDGRTGMPSQLGPSLPVSLLLYAAVWTLGYPIDTLAAMPEYVTLVVAGGGALMLLIAAYYMRNAARGDRTTLFFVLWAILFILPGLRAMTASTRTLCTATIGWSYLLSAVIVSTNARVGIAPLSVRTVLNATNGIVSICCAIATVLVMNRVEVSSEERLERALASLERPLKDGDALVLKQADSALEIICAGDRLEFMTGKKGVSATYLFPPSVSVNVIRVDDKTALLRARDGALLGTRFHRLTRGPTWEPRTGDAFHLSHVTIEVAKANDNGDVAELRLTFPGGLDDPRIHFDPKEFAAALRSRPAASAVSQAFVR